MENSAPNRMTFLKAFLYFFLFGFVLGGFIYLSFFGLIARKADLFKNKECEIEIFAGATVPLDAEIPTESCGIQVWRKNSIWAIFVFILTAVYWIPYLLLGAFVWQKAYHKYFEQHRLRGFLLIVMALLIPSAITCMILFSEFTFARP